MYRGTERPEEEYDNGLKVTYRNAKTGLVERKDPYILRVVQGAHGGKTQLWERPAGSGNLWDKPLVKTANPVGRWVYEEKEVNGVLSKVGKHDPKAEHIDWHPPLTEDQKVARESAKKDTRIAELEKELASIKAEKAAKQAPLKTANKGKGA